MKLAIIILLLLYFGTAIFSGLAFSTQSGAYSFTAIILLAVAMLEIGIVDGLTSHTVSNDKAMSVENFWWNKEYSVFFNIGSWIFSIYLMITISTCGITCASLFTTSTFLKVIFVLAVLIVALPLPIFMGICIGKKILSKRKSQLV